MPADGRPRGLLLLPLVAGVACGACNPVAVLVRPEGNGGWNAERRHRELTRLARAADVDLDPLADVAGDDAPRGAAEPPGVANGDAPAVWAERAADVSTGEQGSTAPTTERHVGRVAPVALDLPTALARAARDNRRLAEARHALAIARQRVFETRGRLFPATTGSGRYTWYTDPLSNAVTLPVASGTGASPAITIRDQELGTVNGTLTLPVDLSGEIRHALLAAQAGYRGEAARVWAVTLEQSVVVIGSYYTLLEAEKLRDVTRQTIAFQRQQLANAEDRFTSGRLTKNELLVVQVNARNAEQQLRQRELVIDQARWALNQAVGLAIDTPVVVADVRTRPRVPDAAAALRTAYSHNPVLGALLEEQQRLEATATSLARGRLPHLSAGGSVDDTTSEVVDPRLIGAGFVGFEWDLGTDTRREARVAEARIAAAQNRTRIERELRQLEQAVRYTQRATEERLSALAAAEIAVGQAEENLRIREQQFDAGRATSEDVLDAEALLAGQRAVLAGALYQAHTRRAELQQLMGAPLEALVNEGGS